MASVQILPGVKVAIAYVDALGYITPMRSDFIGETHNTTYHALEVRDGMRFTVQLTFDLYLLGASQAEFIEVAMRFDGFVVAHSHIPVIDIRAGRGVYNFLAFADGMTGMWKTAEFRALATGPSSVLADATYHRHAQYVGVIQVDLRHERGSPVLGRVGARYNLRHDVSHSKEIRNGIRATHRAHYDNPSLQRLTMPVVVHNAQVGDTGHFLSHYGTREMITQLHLERQGGLAVPEILTSREGSPHTQTGVPSRAANPDLQSRNVGAVQYYLNAAVPLMRFPMPPPGPTPNAPRMQLPSAPRADPTPGLDAPGRPLSPPPLQQEAPDRRQSTPAPRSSNATATMGPTTTGLSTLSLAQASANPLGARASSLPATSQTQSGTRSIDAGLQASQLKKKNATLGPKQTVRKGPSQSLAPTASAAAGSSIDTAIAIDPEATPTPATGGGSASTLPVTSQAQSMTAPAGVGVSAVPVNTQAVVPTTATGGDDVSSLPVADTSAEVGVSAVSVNPHATSAPATGGGGGGVSTLPVTGSSQAQSTTASAGAGVSTISVNPRATSTPATGGGNVPSLPVNPPVVSAPAAGGGGVPPFPLLLPQRPPRRTGTGNIFRTSRVLKSTASEMVPHQFDSDGPSKKKRKGNGP